MKKIIAILYLPFDNTQLLLAKDSIQLVHYAKETNL